MIAIPIIQSAKKRLRQSKKRQRRNVTRKVALRQVVRELKSKVAEGDRSGAESLIPELARAADNAAKHNTIHKNKASRIKSQWAKKVQSL